MDADLDRLVRLVTSNQITFRRDAGGWRAVCRCGPKPYLNEMGPWLPRAVVAIEDRRFLQHRGVDPLGIGRAVYRRVLGRSREGGSTLTQQLVKNTVLDARRTATRKLEEARVALRLEGRMGKRRLLRAYLNQMVFAHSRGRLVVGVEQAARHFYGRRARDLNLFEAATIAGLLKAPSRLDPRRHPERARARATLVLNAMLRDGAITARDRDFALAPVSRRTRGPLAPLLVETRPFTDWVLANLRERLPGFRPSAFTRIPVTLEMQSQAAADRALREATPNTRALGGEYGYVTASAAGSRAGAGRVVVMVGGSNFGRRPFNFAVQARRQPASTFKPVVFLAALEAGARPNATWAPAMARSDNDLPRALFREAGAERVADVARRLGIASPLRLDTSLALGTSEATLLEMVSAYGTLADGGRRMRLWGAWGVVDEGEVVWWRETRGADGGAEAAGKQAIGAEQGVAADHAATLGPVLRAVSAPGGTAYGAVAPDVAGKTGTSDGNRDAWFIGFDTRRVSGLWLGHPDGRGLGEIDGTDAAVVWGKVDAALPRE